MSSDLIKAGSSSSDWRTLSESFTKVQRFNGSSEYTTYWIATAKDGTQYKLEDPWATSFPYTRNYVKVGSGASAYCRDYDWRYSATVITDTLGNTINIDYARETGKYNCLGGPLPPTTTSPRPSTPRP